VEVSKRLRPAHIVVVEFTKQFLGGVVNPAPRRGDLQEGRVLRWYDNLDRCSGQVRL
jgi:hypothetical protein